MSKVQLMKQQFIILIRYSNRVRWCMASCCLALFLQVFLSSLNDHFYDVVLSGNPVASWIFDAISYATDTILLMMVFGFVCIFYQEFKMRKSLKALKYGKEGNHGWFFKYNGHWSCQP